MTTSRLRRDTVSMSGLRHRAGSVRPPGTEPLDDPRPSPLAGVVPYPLPLHNRRFRQPGPLRTRILRLCRNRVGPGLHAPDLSTAGGVTVGLPPRWPGCQSAAVQQLSRLYHIGLTIGAGNPGSQASCPHPTRQSTGGAVPIAAPPHPARQGHACPKRRDHHQHHRVACMHVGSRGCKLA